MIPTLVGIAVLVLIGWLTWTNLQRARATRHWIVSITPEQRADALYRAIGPARERRKREAMEFYDVERDGL